MLGYPAHFGQIECLKLVASPRFTDKRLGYLGIMLLLDENQEVLTLVTNSLKKCVLFTSLSLSHESELHADDGSSARSDMNHSSASTVSLALATFANIASEEMARDLVTEIERCLGSGNAYIRKKAALAALRSLYKVPELVDHFEGRAMSLLSDRNHGVLLTGITLVTEMARLVGSDPFRKVRPSRSRLHVRLLETDALPLSPAGGPAPRAPPQGARRDQLLARARRERHHGPVPPGQDPAPPAVARQGRRRGERGHERHPRPGRDQHRGGQERRQLDPVRDGPHDPRHRSRQRPARHGHQHPRQVPRQPRQQHSLRRAQHSSQGRRHGHERRPAPPRHHPRLPARWRHLDPPPRARALVRARQRDERARPDARAPRLPRGGRQRVQARHDDPGVRRRRTLCAQPPVAHRHGPARPQARASTSLPLFLSPSLPASCARLRERQG